MIVRAISANRNNYNYGIYKHQIPKNNIAKPNNVINFRSVYKLGKGFEFVNKNNIDALTTLFCNYRKNAGQINVSVDKTKEFLENLIQNPEHKIMLIKDDDKEAGFMLFSKTYSTIDLHPFLTIDALYVSPEFRGKKLATKCVQELQEYAKFNNYKGIHVKTWANNPASNNLSICRFTFDAFIPTALPISTYDGG